VECLSNADCPLAQWRGEEARTKTVCNSDLGYICVLVVLLELSVKLMPTALDPLRPVPLHNKSVLNACMIPTVEEPHPPVPPINKSVCSACVIVTALDMDPLAIMD
jgi:hypothetical protein